MKLKHAITDPEKLKTWLHLHSTSITAWSGLTATVILIFFAFSDGDFSFLLTLSSIVGLFSFVVVALIIYTTQSAAGVSLRMMELYCIVFFARLCSIMPFEGYLPFDSTGDWIYQLSECLALTFAVLIVYLCRIQYRDTYDSSVDILNPIFLIIPTSLLAIVFHPSLNGSFIFDVMWTFALYLESVACLAQILMFQKEGKVEPFTTHFLAAQALSKLLGFLFWVTSHKELSNSAGKLSPYVGSFVMVMQIGQLALMGDFIYHYIRCVSRGISTQYLLSENV